MYHLGIIQYSNIGGVWGVDHSFHLGSPYFTLDTNLNTIGTTPLRLIDGGTGPCLVLNKVTELWEKLDPCDNAVGVCKSKLGKY